MQNELNFKPGSENLYSNSGYLVLAIIIRRVSGMSIGSYAQQNIFEPLEMKNTFIYEDGAKVVKNRAIGYSKEGNEYKREHHFDFVVGGDGQVYTTVEDFFKWSENFKSSKIGNDTFLDKMLTKGILNNFFSDSYSNPRTSPSPRFSRNSEATELGESIYSDSPFPGLWLSFSSRLLIRSCSISFFCVSEAGASWLFF